MCISHWWKEEEVVLIEVIIVLHVIHNIYQVIVLAIHFLRNQIRVHYNLHLLMLMSTIQSIQWRVCEMNITFVVTRYQHYRRRSSRSHLVSTWQSNRIYR